MRALGALSDWPVGTAAGGVLRREGAEGSPVTVVDEVGPRERPFPWASVTKLCTTVAVLVAVEERSVSLDDLAGPSGSTLAHLLAHASGLGPRPGEVLAPPARRRIYSSPGFEVAAQHLAAAVAMPFSDYLTEGVLHPLGMRGARLAAGTSPAAGMYGTLADLLALGTELLRPTLIHGSTLHHATGVAFPGLSGVLPGFGPQLACDWGLGFEVKGMKSPHWTGRRNGPTTFGHFGQSGGFLWVDPVAGVACAVLTDRLFGPWAQQAWPALADDVLAELGR